MNADERRSFLLIEETETKGFSEGGVREALPTEICPTIFKHFEIP
jgi:hypothetical protein